MKAMLTRYDADAAEWSRPWEDGEPERRIRGRADSWRFDPVRTQQEVAEILGVSRGTVFKEERSAIRKIAEMIGGVK